MKTYILEGSVVDQLPDNEELNVHNAFELRTEGRLLFVWLLVLVVVFVCLFVIGVVFSLLFFF